MVSGHHFCIAAMQFNNSKSKSPPLLFPSTSFLIRSRESLVQTEFLKCVALMLDKNSLIPCQVSPSFRLTFGDDSCIFNSGCSVIEVTFPTAKGCKLGFIKFKNHYAASVTVRIKFKNKERRQNVWKTVLKDRILMPNPHHVEGSQDYYVIDCMKEFLFAQDNVTALRLILRQPSPHWLHFNLEEVEMYLPNQRKSKPENSEEEKPEDETNLIGDDDIEEGTVQYGQDYENLFSNVKRIVALAKNETVNSALKESASGRFDIGGKYDLNLLSYS